MGRANKRDTEIRALLEDVQAEVMMVERLIPVTRVRMEQASESVPGVAVPAIKEVDEYAKSMRVIGDQVKAALDKLKEG